MQKLVTILNTRLLSSSYNVKIGFQISQIQSQKSYVVGAGNQKYRQISQILKEHEENKRRIVAALAKQQSQGLCAFLFLHFYFRLSVKSANANLMDSFVSPFLWKRKLKDLVNLLIVFTSIPLEGTFCTHSKGSISTARIAIARKNSSTQKCQLLDAC
jgi:hypothetical protein